MPRFCGALASDLIPKQIFSLSPGVCTLAAPVGFTRHYMFRKHGNLRRRLSQILPWISLLFTLAFAVSCGSNVVAPPPVATVSVSAPGTKVTAGNNTLQFTANVQNAQNSAVNWQVNGATLGNAVVGQVSATGLYTGPMSVPAGGTVTVSAVLASDATKSASATITILAAQPTSGVLSWRNDLAISGVNTQESALTPTTVSSGRFGKLFSCPVDGYLYAQPLYVANLAVPGVGTHNVVFVATEHDSVYAFDADTNPCQTIWQASFIHPAVGVLTIPSCPFSGVLPAACLNGKDENDVGSDDITPEIGITGTPTIDPATNTLYVVAATKEPPAANPTYFLRLHALDIATGTEKSGGPVVIQASVPGTGTGSTPVAGVPTVSFVPLIQNQRCGLQLAGGYLYIAFASHGDQGAYHGWVLAYATAALGQNSVPLTFNATPNGSQAGIWQSGAPPSVDASGNIFVATGNGSFSATSSDPPSDWGDTAFKLSPAQSGLTVLDSFTPFEQQQLNANDLDLGSGGVLVLPDQAGTAPPPHLAIAVGKEGKLYILDRDSLGGFAAPPGPDRIVNTLVLSSRIFSTPIYWQGTLYVAANGANLQAYPMASLAAGLPAIAPVSQSSETFSFPGATPVISANGSLNGIIWVLNVSGFSGTGTARLAVLHAYDATNLATELYSSSQRSGDGAGGAVKFSVPTVANGKVYVGTQTEVSVYGLLP
jgi:hypothetical protein